MQIYHVGLHVHNQRDSPVFVQKHTLDACNFLGATHKLNEILSNERGHSTHLIHPWAQTKNN